MGKIGFSRNYVLRELEFITNRIRKCDVINIECEDHFFDILESAVSLLKEKDPVSPEIDGDARSTWWYVCGECHTAIDTRDKYCRECGRKIKWK